VNSRFSTAEQGKRLVLTALAAEMPLNAKACTTAVGGGPVPRRIKSVT